MEKFTEYAKVPAVSAFLEWHAKEKTVSSSGVSRGLHVDMSLKFMVPRMILQNWTDRSLSIADRGCTPVFLDFTRGRCRFVEWHWHCAAKRCRVEAEQLS